MLGQRFRYRKVVRGNELAEDALACLLCLSLVAGRLEVRSDLAAQLF